MPESVSVPQTHGIVGEAIDAPRWVLSSEASSTITDWSYTRRRKVLCLTLLGGLFTEPR